jgi:hypothetical protein
VLDSFYVNRVGNSSLSSLHGIVPVMYVGYWIIFVPKGGALERYATVADLSACLFGVIFDSWDHLGALSISIR